MFDLSDPNTFWLNVTNLGLGLVTLICFAVVGYSVVQEALAHYRARKAVEADDHSFVAADLGLTMADGGERIKKTAHRVSKKEVRQEPKPDQNPEPKQ